MGPPAPSLGDLALQAGRGDAGALEGLYDATRRRAYGLALRILCDGEAAEEAALEVYTRIWRGAVRYDPGRGSVEAWLATLIRSRAIDVLRSRARHWTREDVLEKAAACLSPADDPEQIAAGNQQAAHVRRAVRGLSPSQREAIAVAYFGGLSYKETAAALGQPVGTVKTRIRAGLSALRSVLAEDHGGMPA